MGILKYTKTKNIIEINNFIKAARIVVAEYLDVDLKEMK